MNYFLLLGAGFSRNWGGWLANEAFEYLLGCEEVRQSATLKSLLWKHQPNGGFEIALAELQDTWVKECAEKITSLPYKSENLENLNKLNNAVEGMFTHMNSAFDSLESLEFKSETRIGPVSNFLQRFDAIFTLNQDLLLEKKYRMGSYLFPPNRKWQGWELPYMREAPYLPAGGVETKKYVPDLLPTGPNADKQPYYKLHGSSDWRDGGNKDLLILGGNKHHAIASHEILKLYFRLFIEALKKPSRLMVIGYGFRDQHINQLIYDAVGRNKTTEIFIVDPSGTDVLKNSNIHMPDFLHGIIGASRRNMRETFIDDMNVEYLKLIKFFQP